MVQPAGGRREAGKLERRDRLYEAALSLFREQGYENTTVDQITRRAGLAKGTFFNYFPTKDAVLRFMGVREIGRLGAASLAGGSASAVGNLKRFMSALADSMTRDRTLVGLIFRKGMTVPELMTGDAGGFSVRPTVSLLIRRAQHMAEIDPRLDPDILTAMLDVLYLQQLVHWCESDATYSLADRLTGIVDLMMMGMSARGRGGVS